MRRPRLFIDEPLRVGAQLSLSKKQAHYLSKVLRLKPGAQLAVFNNGSGDFLGELVAQKMGLSVALSAYHDRSSAIPSLAVTLACALARNDCMEAMLRHGTELGVSAFQVLISERSATYRDETQLIKRLQHWRNILISACQQCGRVELPVLRNPLTIDEWLNDADAPQCIAVDPNATISLAELKVEASSTLNLVIGPEGGFSDRELRKLCEQGIALAQLGPRILRVETATLCSLSILQARFGDLKNPKQDSLKF